LVDAKEVLGVSPETLPELFITIGGDAAARKILTSLFDNQQPMVALLELASLPWMSVMTTAVDPLISQAFLSVGSQRRIVELGPGQLAAVPRARSGQLLYLIRAFGTPDAEGPGRTPVSAAMLAEARMIRLPAVLAELPRLIGLHGYVAVEGISERDWLNEQALSALCVTLSSLPAGRVFWFGPVSDGVRSALAGKAHFEQGSLQDHLPEWAKDEHVQHSLGAARDRVFGIGDRVVTVEQEGRRTRIHLTGPEWRSISQIGSLIDDTTVSELQAQETGVRSDLIAYLRRSHAGVPDWTGPARGFVFEREHIASLIQAVRAFVSERKTSILDSAEDTRGVRRVPFIVSGPPASGKTLGLLHAAWTLRAAHRLCVLWLLPSLAGLNLTGIERVCRLLESKGVRWIVLFLDSLELEEYFRLKRRLEPEGRRILVVGAESRLRPPKENAPDDGPGELRRFPLENRMSTGEAAAFRDFLARHAIDVPSDAEDSRDFLRSLSIAVPETELGALPSLIDEYEQVLKDARTQDGAASNEPLPGSFADQLRTLFPDLVTQAKDQSSLESRFSSDPTLKNLLNLVLFCAQLDRPMAVDLLFKVLGSELISKYSVFAKAFANTALVQEVELDHNGTVALTTGHQLYAMWLLRGLIPARPVQLELLRNLAMAIDWDPNAYPGDKPLQDFVLDLLRAVGPRGEYKYLYSSRDSLNRLRELIGEVREHFGIEHPKLLTLEAIILGDLAVRESADMPRSAKERCQLALTLLSEAEDLLRVRRASDVRNFELQRALTLASDIRGTLINVMLRGKGIGAGTDVEEVIAELSRIEADAIRTQAYSATYHPLDIVCWSHRDAFDYLPQDLDPAIRVKLVETIESMLELATEEPLDPSQLQRYKLRQQEVQYRLGNRNLSEQLAEEMRRHGDFTGELSLARDRLRDAEQHGKNLATACLSELERLFGFRPRILSQAHAVRFMHGLWVGSFLEGKLGHGSPKLVKASPKHWRMLEEITRVRLQAAEHSELPYAMFFLGWALYELDEPREAREVFSRLGQQSFGNPRRVGELAYLTNAEGSRRILRVKVVHARAGQVRISVPELDAQVMDLRPEVETQIAPAGLRLGELVEVSIALNYRGAHARPPRE
jgi:hypothetical protein